MGWLRYVALVFALLWASMASLGQKSALTPLDQTPLDKRILEADAMQDRGALQEAQVAYESILQILIAQEPGPQLGHVLNGLSNVASSLGKNNDAVDFATRANQIYRKLGDTKGQAYALNSQGIAQGELGLYSDAQASFRQALGFCRAIQDFKTEVRTLNNLGNAYYFPGNYLEALRSYQDAWRVVESRASDPWNGYWQQITKINEATLYQRLGRYQTALRIYRQIQTSKGLTASDKAHLLTNLGALYRRLGDPWKALDSYRAALNLYSHQHDAAGEISVLKNIGIVYALDQEDLGRARQSFQKSLARASQSHNQREEMQAHLYLGETLLRGSDAKGAEREFHLALAKARELATEEEQWKALFGIGRAEELQGQSAAAEAEYREAISIIEAARFQLQLPALRAEFFADKRDVYDALISLLTNKNDVKNVFIFLEGSRARTFQDRLFTMHSGQSATPAPPDLTEIQKHLDSSTILLEYWASGNRLALIWCTSQSYGMEKVDISSGYQSALDLLRDLPGSLGGNWQSRMGVLRPLVPAGLPLPATLRHMVIVPDGWLSSVPFDLIPLAGSSNTLIERFDISYLPTAALLRRSRNAGIGVRLPWKRELAAFGDPVVPAESKGRETIDAASALAPLPYSAHEIRSIAAMTPGKAEMFLGTGDTKRNFLDGQAGSAPILHVSSHAYSDVDVPENSRIVFSPAAPSNTPDYIFLRELYDLDLHQVDLATLSACDTERGKMIRGEGVQAFSRALLVAGARSSLTALWRVGDQPTSEFMKQFYYFALVRRQTKAEALQSAKLKFLNSNTELENPANWAGFFLTGDGASTLPNYLSWSALVIGATAAVSFVVAGLWMTLRVRRRIHGFDRA